MKAYTWKTSHEFRLEAEYSERLAEKSVNLDGDVINTGKKEKIELARLTLYVDGKKYDQCNGGTNWWRIIDLDDLGLKRIWGLSKVAFTAEVAEEIEKFLAEVIAEGKAEEVTAHEAEEKAQETAEEIERLENLITKIEKQSEIPTREEAKAIMRNYNNLHNEGGEGYVPYIYSREEYESAKKRLRELRTR